MKPKVKTFKPILTVFLISFLISAFFFYLIDTRKIEKTKISTIQTGNKPYPLLDSHTVKNIIFLIGDGMGLATLVTARTSSRGPDGKLYIERMPVTGLINTHSANSLVTDSAAAATAMVTGYKTNNGMISVTPEGKKLLTIMEVWQQEGKATGLIATCRITHATPAAFVTHTLSRDYEAEIARQLIQSKVNILLGGGRDYFLPKSTPESQRDDDRNLIDEAKNLGYTIIDTADQLKVTTAKKILGLFAMSSLSPGESKPDLAQMTKKAIELLNRDEKGFFLMVEGSQIDWSAHDNDISEMVERILLFDEAVKVAIEFAMGKKDTLVIVTTDHDTGGLSIINGSGADRQLTIRWATTKHTGNSVPLFAFGPSALRFSGIHDNTEIPKILAEILKKGDFPPPLIP